MHRTPYPQPSERTRRGPWSRVACGLLSAVALGYWTSPIPLAAQGTAAARASTTASSAERANSDLARKLDHEVSVEWKQAPLGSVLHDLAASGQFHVLLDRRVDPERTATLALRKVTIREGLSQLVAAQDLGLSLFGPVVYVGPPAAADRLRTLAVLRGADVMRLPRNLRQPWVTVAPWSWERFSTPRELIARLTRQAGIELAGVNLVPHDLWPAVELPPLSVADRLTLLLAEFDLTYRIAADGRSAELVPIPSQLEVERRYPAGSDPEQLAKRWRARVPAAAISVDGKQLVVRASVEDHERLRHPPTSRPAATDSKLPDPELVRIARLELKELPLGQAINELARQLSLKVEMDRAACESAGVSFDKPVSLDLKNATIDDVWRAALDPVGLQFERTGRTVKIGPTGD